MVRYSSRGVKSWRAAGVALVSAFLAATLLAPTPALAADSDGATIRGTISSGLGVPVEGATVTVWAPGDVTAGAALTNAAGGYSISGLASGRYVMQIAVPEGSWLEPRWYPEVDAFANGTAIFLPESANKRIDLGVRPIGSLSGVVRTGAGPAGNATVAAYLNHGLAGTATTDSSGRYVLENLEAGDYALSFTPRAGEPYLAEWWKNKPNIDSATLATVVPGTTQRGFDAVLALGGSITGTVTAVDSRGAGIRGVEVTARTSSAALVASATTNSKGRYVLTGLPTGDYHLHFGTARVRKYAAQWLSNSSTVDGTRFAVVKAGAVSTGKNATLRRGATISGRVTRSDAPTDGLGSVVVTAFDKFGFAVSTTTTTTDGRYTLHGIPPERFTLGYHHSVVESPYVDEYWKNEPSIDSAGYFTVAARSAVTRRDAVLERGSIVSGSVRLDNATQDPARLALVFLYDSRREVVAETYTNGWGKYTFPAITAGTYRLKFMGSQTTWWNDAVSFESSTPLVLGGEDLVADATLMDKPKYFDARPVPVITGDVRVGGVIEADAGAWAPAPVELSYEWVQDSGIIAGAIGRSFTIPPELVGSWIAVYVTAGKSGYEPAEVGSELTVTVAPGTIPATTPSVAGTPAVGKKLTAVTGDWGVPGIDYSYRWKRDGKNISGATRSTYRGAVKDAGHRISVTVTGRADGYVNRAMSSGKVTIAKR